MNFSRFDLVTVGGGVGASTLALSMAKHSAQVLMLERETQFRDRVRGEALAPWGVAEAKEFGIAELLLNTCAKVVPWVEMGFGPRNLWKRLRRKRRSLRFLIRRCRKRCWPKRSEQECKYVEVSQ
jgi:2-polyprenyl-6-methoxyphenol hydroxylase-like FAD-dependent oxidoreductase